jgi:hypothetical protein
MFMDPTSPSGSVPTLNELGIRGGGGGGQQGAVDVSSNPNFEAIWCNGSRMSC